MSVALAVRHDWVKVIAVGSADDVLRGRASEYRHRGVALTARPTVIAALGEVSKDPDAIILVPTDLAEMPAVEFVDLVAALAHVPVIVGIAPGCPPATLRELLEHGVASTVGLPCTPASLARAIHSVPERQLESAPLECGALTLDPSEHRVTWHGSDVRLAPKEFEILRYLLDSHPGVVSLDVLVREFEHGATDKHMRVRSAITRMRSRFTALVPERPSPIETVHKIGYRINAASCVEDPVPSHR